MTASISLRCFALSAALALASCGGGSDEPSEPSIEQRSDAARITAEGNAACTALGPFYWEIGDHGGRLASGQAGGNLYDATTPMPIASASKWLYAVYAAERRGAAGLDAAADVPFLNFTSGYSNFPLPTCEDTNGTVADCLEGRRGLQNQEEAQDQLFHYNSGHLQRHAADIGLGALHNAELAAEIGATLGMALAYTQPQLAGGGYTSAGEYAKVLRRLLAASTAPLRLGALLGSHGVCASSDQTICSTSAGSPTDQDWSYSLGHWLESPAGDGAFSSAGAFGFYPWVDADRRYYGVLAREEFDSAEQQGFASSRCGGLLRRAWSTALPQ